ncbi:MAG: hypothetical protein KAS49_00420 [Candidatus Cloacimonetes bacterium]|nr:hypothetical protein [Candidatus Cloacimonadota bacterium]
MRILIFCILTIFSINHLTSITIPFSSEKAKTNNNLVSKFTRTDPADGKEIELDTNCWIWYDKKNIYLHWEAEIDNSFKKGSLTSRERTPEADHLSLEIITEPDSYVAYGFMFFPYENKIDYIRDKNLSTNIAWNSNYKYNSEINNNLWLIDAKIPIKSLRFNSKPPYQWKIILNRYLKHKDENFSYPNTSTRMEHNYFNTASNITLNGEIIKDHNLYFRPYYIHHIKHTNSSNIKFNDAGFDLSFNPTSSSKLKVTINPDFSDIPLDTITDIYNQRFASDLPENRYFFVEDINAFNTSHELFYSRNILQPQYALKINGNSNNFSFGILSSQDKKIIAFDDYTQENYISNHDDIFNIIALKPSVENLNMEITLLNRMNENYHNEVLHLKPNWQFSKNQSIWCEANISNKVINNDSKYGSYYKLGYSFASTKANLKISYDRISKEYSADMGKIDDTNYDNFNIELSHKKDINNLIFKKAYTTLAFDNQNELEKYKNKMRYYLLNSTLTTTFNVAFNFDSTYKNELYLDKYHKQHIVTIGSIWYNYRWFRPEIRFNKLKTLVFELGKTYECLWTQTAITSGINKFTSCRITSDHIKYFGSPDHQGWDDEYWLINFDTDIAFSDAFSISAGLRFDSYNELDNLSFFSNLQWKHKNIFSIIAGYKHSPDQAYIPFTNSNTLFIKISSEFK